MSEIDDLVAKIMKQMQENGATTSESTTNTNVETSNMTAKDYPLYGKHRNDVETPKGKKLDSISLEDVVAGKVPASNFRITPAALKMQGEIAASAGRPAIQRNFQRAAELTKVPDERLLEMYDALRPFRSTKKELMDIAEELRNKYNAVICANWFEEAANYYESRKKLKGDN